MFSLVLVFISQFIAVYAQVFGINNLKLYFDTVVTVNSEKDYLLEAIDKSIMKRVEIAGV